MLVFLADVGFRASYNKGLRIRITLNADPDPAFILLRMRIQLFTLMRIRIRKPGYNDIKKHGLLYFRFLFHGLAAGCKEPRLYSWAMCISDAALDS
jgi:hypothetical protein